MTSVAKLGLPRGSSQPLPLSQTHRSFLLLLCDIGFLKPKLRGILCTTYGKGNLFFHKGQGGLPSLGAEIPKYSAPKAPSLRNCSHPATTHTSQQLQPLLLSTRGNTASDTNIQLLLNEEPMSIQGEEPHARNGPALASAASQPWMASPGANTFAHRPSHAVTATRCRSMELAGG